MVDTRFSLGNAALLIKSLNDDRCSITLDQNGKLTKLGEECRSIIIKRLLKLFSEGVKEVDGTIEGVDICWIASFSVQHSSVYAGRKEGMLSIFFQSSEGIVIDRVDLCENEVSSALAELKSLTSQ